MYINISHSNPKSLCECNGSPLPQVATHISTVCPLALQLASKHFTTIELYTLIGVYGTERQCCASFPIRYSLESRCPLYMSMDSPHWRAEIPKIHFINMAWSANLFHSSQGG